MVEEGWDSCRGEGVKRWLTALAVAAMGRVVGMDANMAMFSVVGEMEKTRDRAY